MHQLGIVNREVASWATETAEQLSCSRPPNGRVAAVTESTISAMGTDPRALVALAVLLCGCSTGELPMRSEDPEGFEACRKLAAALDAEDDFLAQLTLAHEAGEHASRASTDVIREAAEPAFEPLSGTRTVEPGTWPPPPLTLNTEELFAACNTEGFWTSGE